MNRYLYNRLFSFGTRGAILLCGVILLFLFGVIVFNGISALSFDFLFTPSTNFGASGGIFYQIVGSLLIVTTAAILVFPVALGTAIFKSEYLKSKRWQKITNIFIYGLNGIPSVIFGIFGLIFFVNIIGTGVSWFVGAIILGMMILPTIILSAYNSINSIPTIYRESASALGLTKWQVITKVLLPQGINGAITGLFIGLARAIGETAPIMFIATAFSGVSFPSSIYEPVSTLPTHILALAQQATNPTALQNAWGTSLVLIILVVILSTSALVLRLRHKSIT
ncbi:phosphate ABC transporter permease PstA [Flavobacteriaceae bacterium AU392]|nr:phosphate ABC transporter permease PstA [Flavobacteriaceae bacterium]RKM84616.1 phosphate ABC transporter permease PstA [Flavobacteriaceae bacterium AU392]